MKHVKSKAKGILALMMSLIIFVGACLPVSALSVSVPSGASPEELCYSVEYADGKIKIKVNAETVYSILEDRQLTKDELKALIPQNILSVLEEGRDVSLDDLKALVAEYVTLDDLKAIADDIPTELLSEYLDLELIEQLMTIEELLNVLPLDVLFESQKLKEAIIGSNGFMDAELVRELVDAGVIDANVLNALFTDAELSEIINVEAAVALLSEESVAEALITSDKLVNSDVIKKLLTVNGIIDGITYDDVYNSGVIELDLLKTLDAIDYTRLEAYLSTKSIDLETLIAEDIVSLDNVTAAGLENYLTVQKGIDVSSDSDVIQYLSENGYTTVSEIPTSAIPELWAIIVRNNPSEGLTLADVDGITFKLDNKQPSELASVFGITLDDVKRENIIIESKLTLENLLNESPTTAVKCVKQSSALRTAIINNVTGNEQTRTNLAETLKELTAPSDGSAAKISANELFTIINDSSSVDAVSVLVDINKAIEKLREHTSPVDDLLNAVGGTSPLNDVISALSSETVTRLIESNKELIFEDKEILKELFDLLEQDGSLRTILSELLQIISGRPDGVKSFTRSALQRTYRLLMTRIDSIRLNDEHILFNGAQFDANALLSALIDLIPENTADIIDNGLSATLSLVVKDTDDSGNTVIGNTYAWGIELSFFGDTAPLKSLTAKLDEHIRLNVNRYIDDDGTLNVDAELSVTVPAAASAVYAEVLNNPEIDTALRAKLLKLPSKTLGDAKTLLHGLTDEELTAIFNTLTEKLDSIKQRAQAALPDTQSSGSKATRAVGNTSVTADDVNTLLDKLTSREYFDKAFGKLLSAFDSLISGRDENTSLTSLYVKNNGVFTLNTSKQLNIIDLLLNTVSLPDEIGILFANKELKVNVGTNATVNDLFVLTGVYADGSEFKTLIPKGTKISVLEELLSTTFVDENGEPYGSDAVIEGHTTLRQRGRYCVNFHFTVRGGTEGLIETVYYDLGDTTISEPSLANTIWAGKRNGYGYEWENNYVLGSQYVIDVYYVETPNNYTLTFECYNELGVRITSFTEQFAFGADASSIYAKIRSEFSYDGTTYRYLRHNDSYVPYAYNVQTDTGDQTVKVYYFASTTHYVRWYDFDGEGNRELASSEWSFGVPSTYPTEAPAAPSRRGYRFVGWSVDVTDTSIYRTPRDINVYAVWESINFVHYVDENGNPLLDSNGNEIVLPYDENGIIGNAPTVPAKRGYTGVWDNVDLTYATGSVTIKPIYVKLVYTAVFIADGETVARVQFDVDNVDAGKLPTVPEVPAKEGYTGRWESYELTLADLEINAVYTLLPSESTDTAAPEPEEESDGNIGWIAVIILLLVVGGGIFGYMHSSNDNDDDGSTPPPPAPAPKEEPKAEEAEEAAEVTEEAVATEPEVTVPVVVENITVSDADMLMSDSFAEKLVRTKKVKATAGLKVIVNLSAINSAFSAGDTVDLQALKQKKLVPQKTAKVKILADGNLEKALNIEANAFSLQAVKMITLTGGTITQIISEE